MITRWKLILISLIAFTSCIEEKKKYADYTEIDLILLEESRFFQTENHVKGLAVALFTSDSLIWKHSFGRSTYRFPINDSTLFGIQSVSKNITALAVMKAQEEGLLHLDSTITSYLPDFRVNSCFEEFPESKITIRMLLSHTSGLPHEAPVGNNFDLTFSSIEQHLESIQQTWLRFPVGSSYAYSNLGFDIAAQVVERVSGITFEEFLQTRIFMPTGMKGSTTNNSVFTKTKNRTEGISRGLRIRHYPIPLIGSGAVYSSLNDMIRYVQMHLNYGIVGNNQIVSRESLLETYAIRMNNYGLGTYIDTTFNSYYLNHNGGGFGYGSSILWFPEFNLGCVVLSNRAVNCYELASTIVFKYLEYTNSEFTKDTLSTEGFSPFVSTISSSKYSYPCLGDSIYKTEWDKYVGTYKVIFKGVKFKGYSKLAMELGIKPYHITINQVDESLFLSGFFGESKLFEHKPGLFFTRHGIAFDLRGSQPTFNNIKLKKKRR